MPLPPETAQLTSPQMKTWYLEGDVYRADREQVGT
jgi:hypothetical protein